MKFTLATRPRQNINFINSRYFVDTILKLITFKSILQLTPNFIAVFFRTIFLLIKFWLFLVRRHFESHEAFGNKKELFVPIRLGSG